MTIQQISVSASYCFGAEPLQLEQLGLVNFVFAPNGSGKTTISNMLSTQPKDPGARKSWLIAPTHYPIRVFNERYRDRVLQERVDGIFTMGEEAGPIANEIDALVIEKRNRQAQRTIWLEEIGQSGDETTRKGLLGEIDREQDKAFDDVFDAHKEVDEEVRKLVFKGFRTDRRKFLEESLRRNASNPVVRDKVTWESLLVRVTAVVGDPVRREPLPALSKDKLLDDEELETLKQTLLETGGGNLHSLIQKISNQDWVSKGREFLDASDDACPFCQQKLPLGFESQLGEYFSDGFDELLSQAKKVHQSASGRISSLRKDLASLKQFLRNDTGIDAEMFRLPLVAVESAIELTQRRIDEKCAHPGRVVAAATGVTELKELSDLIGEANVIVAEHNKLIDNSKRERELAVEDGWALFLTSGQVSASLRQFGGITTKKNEQIDELRKKVTSSEMNDATDDLKIADLSSRIANTVAVAGRINKLLIAMGFHRFQLTTDESVSGGYRIVRCDGSLAHESLSEGEKSFLCFAYFWESIFGAGVAGEQPQDVVAVFDDPISSLDSETLFMVAAYIRDAAAMVVSQSTNLRQLIVLTHNTQFHLEAAYESSQSPMAERHFYRLFKRSDGLTAVLDDQNKCRIRGSYPLLWDSVVEAARSGSDSQLIQVGVFNIVRRIIEGYFKTIGQVKDYRRPEGVTPQDEKVMNMFHMWANARSHSITDDVDQTLDAGGTQNFLRVFRRYFDLQGHEAHFDMMLKASDAADLTEAGQVFESSEVLLASS